MARVFEAKVRRLGNSLAVIVPDSVAKEAGAHEGDKVKVSVLTTRSSASKKSFIDFVGIDFGAKKFQRDERARL